MRMCPYCGGMHAPGMCPIMMPPSMPMPPMVPPSMPMPPMMPPSMPVPLPTPLPAPIGGGMEPGMHDMMMEHTRMLEHIVQRVDQIYQMCQSMQTGMAKG